MLISYCFKAVCDAVVFSSIWEVINLILLDVWSNLAMSSSTGAAFALDVGLHVNAALIPSGLSSSLVRPVASQQRIFVCWADFQM